jgi:hypothetical protein
MVFFFLIPSLEKLRVKAGKTMVALSAKTGHKEIFAVYGTVRALWPQMFPAQVLPDLQGNGLVRQRSLSND